MSNCKSVPVKIFNRFRNSISIP
uniref:Uncharacterized protein n=1 Tax=Arundo donax TaxID=35708 RepID=A0A0A8YW97_ARUDO